MGSRLHPLLAADLVVPDLAAGDRNGILREMAAVLKARGRIADDGELAARLAARENMGSTAIGRGIAIPHCKANGLGRPLVLLAVSRKGASFDAADGKPVHLFFLVVTPPEDPALSLQILAAIARLSRRSRGLQRKILAAAGASDILEIVREEEDKSAA
ncbi:MAG: PTS sugar transporter subunit IIA [Candidatus Aminicenantes bacterium]|nr:PTS sugar transporter subunit IIA [Candidatus Aminicenantes bacterium]